MEPLKILTSDTRNYLWCTEAFVKVNSQWADYIIIVDQMSTDGTRELLQQYSKVIIVDNDDLQYSETKRCELELQTARRIANGQDYILFHLAIDEVIPDYFQKTKDWDRIMSSNQGEVFCLQWANILPGGERYYIPDSWMARIFHDDYKTKYDNQGLDMHTHCIPYPQNAKETLIKDFQIIHFGDINDTWTFYKQLYYQFVDFEKNNRSVISLSRMYNRLDEEHFLMPVPDNLHQICKLVHDTPNPIFIDYIKGFISENSIHRYSKLHVWNDQLLNKLQIKDPRSTKIKILHYYLEKSNRFRKCIFIRAFDKLLKRFI